MWPDSSTGIGTLGQYLTFAKQDLRPSGELNGHGLALLLQFTEQSPLHPARRNPPERGGRTGYETTSDKAARDPVAGN